MATFIASNAEVEEGAELGEGSSVWDHSVIRSKAMIGSHCVIGRGVYLGSGVRLGRNVKVQNHALVYEPAVIEDGVLIGPAVVLTNDHFPRAVDPDGNLKGEGDWESEGVHVKEGASLGARAVCVAPLTIGRWAMVAAGAVVTKDVIDFALVAGVPARRIGWVGRAGFPLKAEGGGRWRCPQTGTIYIEVKNELTESA